LCFLCSYLQSELILFLAHNELNFIFFFPLLSIALKIIHIFRTLPKKDNKLKGIKNFFERERERERERVDNSEDSDNHWVLIFRTLSEKNPPKGGKYYELRR